MSRALRLAAMMRAATRENNEEQRRAQRPLRDVALRTDGRRLKLEHPLEASECKDIANTFTNVEQYKLDSAASSLAVDANQLVQTDACDLVYVAIIEAPTGGVRLLFEEIVEIDPQFSRRVHLIEVIR